MAKVDRITAEIEMLVNEWAIWVIMNHEKSPLGYPHETVEKRIIEGTSGGVGGKGRSTVPPEVFRKCDPRLPAVSNAFFKMPAQWGHAIYCRHLAPAKTQAPGGVEGRVIELRTETHRRDYYCDRWRCGKTAYFTNVTLAYAYIMGAIRRDN